MEALQPLLGWVGEMWHCDEIITAPRPRLGILVRPQVAIGEGSCWGCGEGDETAGSSSARSTRW